LEENKTEEGPFSEIAAEQSASGEQAAAEEISSSRAEELCREYFKDYAVSSADYAGETISRNIQTYNFFLRDDQGRQIFAQIAKKGGALVEFDFYENCTEKNFDLARAKTIAEEYLEGLGYENMTAVWVNESGTLATFNFAYEEDGTVYYPDLVKVKVCESKGKVVGLDAVAFLKNHRSRVETNAKITLADAQSKLNKNVQVESSRLTVIPVENEEIAAYEFLCAYGDESYFIYINAVTGEEERILRVADSAQGRVLQ
jgi:spore germination protein